MQSHSRHRPLSLSVFSALAALSMHNAAQADFLEPDKLKYTVGKWKISTARWGQGCVAELTYDTAAESYVSIGGKLASSISFLVTISPEKVGRSRADEFLDTLHNPEIVLRRDRYSTEPYEYRGTVGVGIENPPADFFNDLSGSKSLRYTENGYEKLSIKLDKIREALPRLIKCIEQHGDK